MFWPRKAGAIRTSTLLNPTTSGRKPAPTSAIANDDDPYVHKDSTNEANKEDNQQHLEGLLKKAGRTWKSYQEDTDLTTISGKLINVVLLKSVWTVPLISFSGSFVSGVNYLNGFDAIQLRGEA